MSEDKDPLKTGLDKLALEILGQVKVGDAIEQSALKALDVLGALSKWYAIKNKVMAQGDDPEEGTGIDEYKERLSAARGGDGDTPNPPEPERDSEPSPNPRPKRQAHNSRGYADNRGDPDFGGPELDRLMASLPGHAGGDADHKHGAGGKRNAAARRNGRGVPGIPGDAESDLDELVGDRGL